MSQKNTRLLLSTTTAKYKINLSCRKEIKFKEKKKKSGSTQRQVTQQYQEGRLPYENTNKHLNAQIHIQTHTLSADAYDSIE